jgi:hypothetical protein
VLEIAGVEVNVKVEVAPGPVAVGRTDIFRLQPLVAIKRTVGMTAANTAQRRKDFMLPPEKRYRGIEAGNKRSQLPHKNKDMFIKSYQKARQYAT